MRHREVGDAADDLRAGTQTLIMTVEAYGMAGRKQSLVTWVPLVSPQVERVQIAAERIIRHSTTELGASARAVADTAIAYVSGHDLLVRSSWRHGRWRSLGVDEGHGAHRRRRTGYCTLMLHCRSIRYTGVPSYSFPQLLQDGNSPMLRLG
jgi:hypothetical protein